MLTIKREGKTVKIVFETDLPFPNEGTGKEGDITLYPFTFEESSAQSAELLCRYLRTRLGDTVWNMRQQEFLSGWKHGKAKKHGKNWFDWFRRTLSMGASHA